MIITLDEFKAHQNIPLSYTTDDNELTDTLMAAIDVVEGLVGSLSPREVTETHYNVSSEYLVLRNARADSLTGVSVQYPGALLGYLPSDFVVDNELGVLRSPVGVYLRGTVTVTYTVDPGFLPASVRLATLIIAKNLWETQRGAQPLPIQGNQDDQLTDTSVYSPGIPARARVLLEPFARGPQVA